MKFWERNKNQLFSYLNDSNINIADRSFMVFSISMVVALYMAILCGLIMREPLTATVSTLLGTVFFTFYVIYVYKSKKIKQARLILAVILALIFLPAMFFTNGGVAGGTPIWLVLGGYYMVLILDGTIRRVLCILSAIILLVCWIISYYHPEYVTQFDRWGRYFDSYVALIIVTFVITVVTVFQTRLYQREVRLSTEKTNELETMNKAQSRFFSSMSHEIRTPITTVLGFNELILRQQDASDEIRKDAMNIQGAGKLLLTLINDILDVSKIEAGKMEIMPADYSVASLLSEIVNIIWLKSEKKGLQFNVDVDPNVPATLYGDEVRIKQVLINLLNNAVKYTKEGSVSLHMECEYLESGDVLLTYTISDTGMGIKAESLPHLFETFRRVDEGRIRHIEGTGLGLAIVKQLVDLMDGQIRVNSVYSQGTSFEVSIRQGVSNKKPIGNFNISSLGDMSAAERFEHSFIAPGARILIVDDNDMNLEVGRRLLEGTDMTVDLASSGQEALRLTLRNRYDVILMDHLMPEMDGSECFAKIRSQKGGMNLNVPVIAFTANAGSEVVEMCNRTGFDGYLVKPVSGHELEDMLLLHLPKDKVVTSPDFVMADSFRNTASGYSRKKTVVIAANSVSDIPPHLAEKLGISILPCRVFTDEGAFYDNVDIDSEELIRYMKDKSKNVRTEPPTEEAYVNFFAKELEKAHHLIYIAFTTGSSEEYERALKASKSFGNVSVVNSECLSSACGILALIAARLAGQNMPVDRILAELEVAKKRIHCSFVTKSTETITRQGKLNPAINSILSTFWLHPVLRMKDDKLGVGRLLFGNIKKCYGRYLDHAFKGKMAPDTSLLIIPYAGMEEEDLLWIEERIRERISFDHIIFLRTSAGVAANCGEGSFGLQYLTRGEKSYNLGEYFEEEDSDDVTASETGKSADEVTRADSVKSADTAASSGVVKTSGVAGTSDKAAGDDPKAKAGPESAAVLEAGARSLADIEGISVEDGLKYCGSEAALKKFLNTFCDSIDNKSKEIEDAYNRGDISFYTIKVHALKSTSRIIGAKELSGLAESLEMAGKEENRAFIDENTGRLLELYRSYKDKKVD
jgi:DegV family protein with EDD domain